MTDNLAAFLPATKAAFEVRPTEKYTPGSHELLIKNTVIAFNPIEWKIAKLGIYPIQFPAILGGSYGGVVEAIGPGVTDFKVGDKVAVAKKGSSQGNQYNSHQRYVVATDDVASKVPENVSVEIAASLTTNIATVVGALGAKAGLDKPNLDAPVSPNGKKILVYGGSSSVGSLAVQYAALAGYTVVTTSSPRNNAFVAKLGAAKVVDHTQPQQNLISELTAEGPYELLFDVISAPSTIAVAGAVLDAQGGGNLYRTTPAMGPETLSQNITNFFAPWPTELDKPEKLHLRNWLFGEFLPQALEKGKIVPLPVEKVKGGLNGINEAIDKLAKGVSGLKLIADPWEE